MGKYSKYQKPGFSGFFYSLLFVLTLVLIIACNSSARKTKSIAYSTLSGETMGTTYHISLETDEPANTKKVVDSILVQINKSVSTYDPKSLISTINSATENEIELPGDIHFETNFEGALSVYSSTKGLFDPTVMPLVNYWGFGYKKGTVQNPSDRTKVDSLLSIIGLDKWDYSKTTSGFQIKKLPGAELDFSAIAKGYAVDYIAQYLESTGIENYMVEIGGEVYAKGLSKKQKPWAIGLNTPTEDAGFTDFEEIVSLNGHGLASSGNYRNFRIVNGIKYGHEINPVTGFSVQTEILGVSVIAENCMLADAYATAFMIMDKNAALELCAKVPGLDACFFYGNKNGGISSEYSDGFDNYLVN